MVDLLRSPTFNDANSTCESVCGRIYFPSTADENDEVAKFLIDQKSWMNIWLRLVYNKTEDAWKDPDNKEILTSELFHRCDAIESCATQYVYMNYRGEWWSNCESDTRLLSSDVVCELT